MSDWWQEILEARRRDGRTDANDGIFEPPYPNSDDPQDQDENYAYEQGFNARRTELGKDFKWQ